MSRWLIILLLVSLAANVFLGGYVGGRFLGGPPFPPPHLKDGERPKPPMRHFTFVDPDDMTPEARESFRSAFEANRETLRDNFVELRRLREAFSDALAAEEWDRAAIEQALADLRAVEGAHQTALTMVIVDVFEGLPAAERKALIEAQRERRHERHEARRAQGHPPGEGRR